MSTNAAQSVLGKHTICHVLILDKSGSMTSVRQSTIDGFNENLIALRKEQENDSEIEQKLYFVTFNDSVSCDIWDKPVNQIKDLTTNTYSPSGSTALYEAIGKTVQRLSEEIRDQLTSQSVNVVVTIFTDGGENSSSQEWRDFGKLKTILEEFRSSRAWTFTFIGCDENTLKTAKELGFSVNNTLNYVPSEKGTKNAFDTLRTSRISYVSKVKSAVRARSTDNKEAADELMSLTTQDFFAENPKEDTDIKDNT